ncbi:MAG: hypothetical protein COT18_07135 [Elusimicrobia bacterium CG08_land_8_20_14_0_20_59_10]|nr:MAG: hypothetical protein COT18_07135 [Elusimicrobia bacterium CG08_land_8_20_14_0_20_59_10]
MRLLIAALLLLPHVCQAGSLPPQFEGSSVNASGTTILKAAKAYTFIQPVGRPAVVAQAAAALPLPPEKPFSVEWPGGGELWAMKDGQPVKLDSWSDLSLPLNPKSFNIGRWFGTFGIQSMGGGDYPASSMNLRVGSTLLRNRYDLAWTYDYYKPAESETYRAAMGLMGRKLMPLSPHGGWNFGAQLSMLNNYGERSGTLGLVTGLNIYLPRGSFDITLLLQDEGAHGLFAGYTVHLTR